jgi:GDP-L-fucose synthase
MKVILFRFQRLLECSGGSAETSKSESVIGLIRLMPANLKGLGDNFKPQTSQVNPALIRKFREAKTGRSPEVAIYGAGNEKS